MSQATLAKSPKPDSNLLVGSEAKNPLPSQVKGNLPYADIVGLSWIFLDNPTSIGITNFPEKMRFDYN